MTVLRCAPGRDLTAHPAAGRGEAYVSVAQHVIQCKKVLVQCRASAQTCPERFTTRGSLTGIRARRRPGEQMRLSEEACATATERAQASPVQPLCSGSCAQTRDMQRGPLGPEPDQALMGGAFPPKPLRVRL